MTWNRKSKFLQALKSDKSLSVYDLACTGKNNTTFSTTYCTAATQMGEGDLPIAAIPCWRPGAMPMHLQGVDSCFGSRCLEGASLQLFLIPIFVLIIIDALMAASIFFLKFRQRFQATFRTHIGSMNKTPHKGMSGVKATITGYKALSDDTDQEMVPMNATFLPSKDNWTGFEAAFDLLGANHTDRSQAEAGLSPHLRAFIKSMRKATDATNFGFSFGYADLVFQPKGSPRPILQNVTGSIERGSLVAVMGGSSAGKSTFVNVLMGKTSNTGGLVSVNNIPGKMKQYKKLTAYVLQDDIVLPELTVFENIVHSARIRLPQTWSDADIRAHVESVIDCLELSHVRDFVVGSVGKPVISGGQRKRASIGMELTLKAIARLGISIIVIIHQPCAEIFDLFDNLILLGNGQTIYEGSQIKATPYFENASFQFPEHSNHADIITDIITGNVRDYKQSGDISKEALVSNWAN
ncbi:hypothetical protein QQZ08_009005 [Neonectria magnoliae]|uniref:ABC transporter domain-containing protein n=1 Tax=Neonectria magnoliae TaxID=2732573 RepID=A0ABR1HRJ5_9HYPO